MFALSSGHCVCASYASFTPLCAGQVYFSIVKVSTGEQQSSWGTRDTWEQEEKHPLHMRLNSVNAQVTTGCTIRQPVLAPPAQWAQALPPQMQEKEICLT